MGRIIISYENMLLFIMFFIPSKKIILLSNGKTHFVIQLRSSN